MKIYIRSTNALNPSTQLCFHCTSSEEQANSIVTNGFDTSLDECCLTTSLYNALGYGESCVACCLSDILKLNLSPFAGNDRSKYSEGCQGAWQDVNFDFGKEYFIWDMSALSSIKWQRFSSGDRSIFDNDLIHRVAILAYEDIFNGQFNPDIVKDAFNLVSKIVSKSGTKFTEEQKQEFYNIIQELCGGDSKWISKFGVSPNIDVWGKWLD